MARKPAAPKPDPTTAVVGDLGPEIIAAPEAATVAPTVAPADDTVDGSDLAALNLAAAGAAGAEEGVAAENPDFGKYESYPVGVFVGFGVTEAVIGDLGSYTVDPDTGRVTAAA